MERERGIVLGVCLALAVAGAVAAYFWFQGPDTHTVEPGAFTETDGGALIGADADAIDGPIEVQTEWVDPAGEEAFQYHGDRIEDVDRVLEVSTTDTEDGEPWLAAHRGSTFTVVLPVPERFDAANVVPIGFSYGEYVVPAPGSTFVPNGSDIPDTWTYLDGAFLPDERKLVVDVPNLGKPDRPTRVGVVEHAYLETPVAQDRPAQTGNQSATSGEAQIASLVGPPALAASHAGPSTGGQGAGSTDTARFVSHGPGTSFQLARQAVGRDMGGVQVDVTGAEGFQLLCYLDDCSEDREILGESIGDRVEAVETALRGAVPQFESLQGQQGPEIRPSVHQINPSEDRYPLRLHGPHAGPGGSEAKCASASGFYQPFLQHVVVCLDGSALVLTDHSVMPSLRATQETTAHELFHAYQFGMQGGGFGVADYDTSVLEGTTVLAQGWEEPTDLSRTLWPPQLTRSIADSEVENDYRAEYLWHHFYETQGITFEQTGQLFQEGLELENADAFIADQPGLDGIGDAYWPFAKDLVYEDERPPELRPPNPTTEAGICELFEGEDWAPSLMDAGRLPHPGALQVDDHRIGIHPEDYEVRIDGSAEKIEASLTGLTSDVYSFEIGAPSAAAQLDEQVWLQITLEAPDETPTPEMRMKLYDEEESGTTACWDDARGREADEVGGSAVIDVWDEEKDAVLLVSNVEIPEGEEMNPVDYELHFKACPIWGQEGANAGGNYHVIGCEDDAGGVGAGSSLTQMGFNPLGLLGLGGLNFQADPADDEPEPGDRIWIESGSDPETGGGITRPSFAYDQVYTAFGLGAIRDLPGPEESPGDFGSGPAMSDITPAGRVTAYDAETGEEQWMATDEDAKLKIGGQPGFSGSGLYPVHEPIVGNGLVYMIGGHFEVQPDLWPENATGRERIPLSSEGILAFDAFTGDLVWEKKPDHDPDRETIHLGAGGVAEMPGEGSEPIPRIDASSLIFLCEDRLFVYGIHSHPGYYTFDGKGWRDEWVQNDPEWTLKLWELDADTGETRRSWELPRGGSSVSIRDCSPVVAGFASPGTLSQFDPETGDVDQQLADIFDPPPDPNATVRTAGVSGMVLEDETVVVGTSIQDGEETRGKIYGLEPGGERWTYEMNTSAPDPVIVNGTVYLLTNEVSLNQEASEEDGPEDPTDVVDQESRLHAVDARTGKEKWVIEASTSMTATPDRVYLGKGLEDLDPMGGSVHAVDPETGETVWTNEEEIPAPEAWTGAYVDGVLYVQAGGNTIALKG